MTDQLHVVLIPAWYTSPAVPYAGAFVKTQARALVRNTGMKVGLIYIDQEGSPGETVRDEQGFVEWTRRGTRMPKWTRLGIALWQRRYVKWARRYVAKHGRPDILHAHGYVGGLAALAISNALDIPYVLTEHTSTVLENSVEKRHLGWITSVYAQAGRLYAVSPSLQQAMTAYTDRTVRVLANCYDEDIFNHNPSPRPDQNGFHFISVGSLVQVKRYDLLLDAMAALPDDRAKLAIVGAGPLRSALGRQCEDLGLGDRVQFKGALDQRNIAQLYREAHAFVSASDTETFGVAMLEALACGLSVIATASGGPESLINGDNGLLVAPGEVNQLTNAMRTMMAAYPNYDQVHIAAQTKQHYNGKMLAARLEGIYHKVTDLHQRNKS